VLVSEPRSGDKIGLQELFSFSLLKEKIRQNTQTFCLGDLCTTYIYFAFPTSCNLPLSMTYIRSCFWRNQQDAAYLGRVEDPGKTWVSFPSLPPSHHPLCVGTDQKLKGWWAKAFKNGMVGKHMTHPFYLAQKWVSHPYMKVENYITHPLWNMNFLMHYPAKSHLVYEIILYILDLHEFLNKLWYKVIWK